MISPVPAEMLRFAFETVVMFGVAAAKVSPVDPMVLLFKVCVWLAKTNVSELVSAGIVSVRDAVCAADEIIAFAPLAPSESWLVVFVKL